MSVASDDLSFDTSYASVSTMEYTLNRACLLGADAMAHVTLRLYSYYTTTGPNIVIGA